MAFDLSKLGVKTNIPKVDFLDYAGLIQGVPKIGKTALARQLPKTILVAFESGYDAEVIDYIDCTGEDGWQKFIDFLDLVEENLEDMGNEIKLLVIDTLEKAYEACEKYTIRKKRIEDKKPYKEIGDIPHGRAYLTKDNYFKDQIERIRELGLKPLYLTHTVVKTIRPKNEEPYDIYVPTVPERCSTIVMPDVSYIMLIKRTTIDGKPTRVLNIKGVEGVEVGSRIYIENDIPFETEAEAIEKLAEAWEAVITKRLREAGIKDDIGKLKDKQDKERIEQALGNIKDKALSFQDAAQLSEWAKQLVAQGKIEQTTIIDILKRAGYKNFNEITIPEEVQLIEKEIRKEVA